MRLSPELEGLAERARSGDRGALEGLVRGIKDAIYGIAVRMLGEPADAEDATQEILVKLVTNLAQFRGESSFATWAYRVACNHLLNVRKRRMENRGLSFELMADMIDAGLAQNLEPSSDPILVRELIVGCTQGMLLCLDREQRLAFILGEILQLTSAEGAHVLDIEPATFRKRLERARTRLTEFLQARCGVYDAANACRCSKQVGFALQTGWIDADKLRYSTHPKLTKDAKPPQELVALLDVAAIYREHPDYVAPDGLVDALKASLGLSAR